MLNRAYSLLEIKRVDEERRTITGMATTPAPDRLGDIVEPDGAQFKLPLPLLWQHNSGAPIGHVTEAKISKDGIEIVAKLAREAEPGRLQERLDEAWQSIKAGLVRGLSIGFKSIEHSNLENGGLRFIKWLWLELSAVTIPANAEASITTIRSLDTAQLAASGRTARGVVHLNPPGASGSRQAQEGTSTMKTYTEQITALENKRAATFAAQEAVAKKGLDDDRTMNEAESEEFDNHQVTIESIDKQLVRLRQLEQNVAKAAKAVKAETPQQGAAARGGEAIVVKTQPVLPPGIEATRIWKCRMNSTLSIMRGGEFRSAAEFATQMYGSDSNVVGILKANVPAGATVAGNWAANLIGAETGAMADFVAYLRPRTILGRFGTDGIPALRSVPFRTPLITETGGGAAWWVGEGKAKPLTSFSYTRTTLAPLKVATICALTEELIRDSSPKADVMVRDSLVSAVRERLDLDFITPSKTAVAGVSPASITNGASTIVSSGDDADAIRLDVRSLLAKFTSVNNPPSSGVWIMGSSNAAALAMMVNPLGQPEFPSMSPTGGALFGMPVIASDYVGAAIVVLANASDIYEADDGEVAVDMSREASLEMSDAPTGSSITPTGTSLVSLWQTNTVGIRAERTINWLRRRTQSVVYLTSADWGGPVHTA
jgi:HK97 family phage prohead protease